MMTNLPIKVSIVTPSYNAMPYLKETIESILRQEYPNVQHIVMDGGSSDGSKELLESYPGIEWRSEKDKGQSDALNKAFALADGEIIGWLNADDTYTDGAIKEAVAYLEEHPEIDMVYTDLNIIDENSQVIGFTKGGEFDPVGLLTFNPIKQPTIFMRRRILDTLKGVDVQYHYVMDREFWLRLGMNGFKTRYLPGKIWANFRMCAGTKTFEHSSKFRDEWFQVIDKAFSHPFFASIPERVKKRAKAENRFDYHLTLMSEEGAQRRSTKKVVYHFFKAVFYTPRQLFKAGFLKVAFSSLLHIEGDKLIKFKKRIQ